MCLKFFSSFDFYLFLSFCFLDVRPLTFFTPKVETTYSRSPLPPFLLPTQPENILLANKADATRVKLCDFGMSHRILGMESLQTICGSPGYMAPEIVKEVRA